MHTFRRAPRGFTLVELLVVIGIIALLISVLLPVLSGVQKRGRLLKCQANMRSCLQMVFTYAAENKGSLPYGWYYNRGNDRIPPFDWQETTADKRLTTAFSIISRMAGKQYTGDDLFIENSASSNPEDVKRNHAPYLRCPEAEQVLPHVCSYALSYLAFITPWYERLIVNHPGPVQTAPAKQTDLLPFMILIFDTAVFPGMNQDIGYVIGRDVDGERIWRQVANPQRRYYSVNDRYASMTPPMGTWKHSAPIGMGGSGASLWKNIDPAPDGPDGFTGPPYVGNLRFRHGKNNTVNVGYADGRVESIEASFNPDRTMKKVDIPRKAFMIKWPKGQGLNEVLP